MGVPIEKFQCKTHAIEFYALYVFYVWSNTTTLKYTTTTTTTMKIVYVQTVLTEEELEKLLKKSGTNNKKDALREAVKHYLKCPYDVEE